MIHERHDHQHSVFATLTYNDDHLPEDLSVSPRAVTLFLKRLRKLLGDRRIRYFAVGEYGKLGRPHYHLIIYGVALNEHRLGPRNGHTYHCLSGPVFEAWRPRGFVQLGLVDYGSTYYVASYITKYSANRTPGQRAAFRRMSKGLGGGWAARNKNRLRADLTLHKQGHEIGVPRYYVKKLREWFPIQGPPYRGSYPGDTVKTAIEARGEEQRKELYNELKEKGVSDAYMFDYQIRENQQKRRNILGKEKLR